MAAYSYTVGEIVTDVSEYLANKTLVTAKAAEWVRKSVLELSTDYEFQGLQSTGPTVTLVPGQSNYPYSFFQLTADDGLNISKVMSFFLYYQVPFLGFNSSNALTGVNLTAKTMAEIEQIINIQSLPIHYCRFNGTFYIGYCPDQSYSCYMRYQKEHPFPNAGTGNATEDPILLDDDWADIIGYSAALRGAISLRLLDYASQFRTILYGDPKFQLSGGTDGEPGLIFRRVSQRERDVERATKKLSLVVARRA